MTPAELLRRRQSLGLTQAALAERLGLHRTSIARWEGAQKIDRPEMLRLALDQLAWLAERARDRSRGLD